MRATTYGWALLALTLLGGGVRWGVLEAGFPVRPAGDELYYVGTAVNLAEGHGHLFNSRQRAFRPPAWSFLLSGRVDVELRQRALHPRHFLVELSELDPRRPDPDLAAFLRPLLAAPLWLGTLLVPLTGLLGLALFDRATGLLAAAGAALSPTLVAFSHSLMSESLFAVLLTGGLALAVAGRDRRSPALAAAAGVVLGAAALTRELGAGAAAICALWSVVSVPPPERRGAWGRAALLLAATLLVVAPWTWRNHQTLGSWVPVSTVGWFAAAEGNTLEHPDWLRPVGPRRLDFKRRFFQIDDEMERVAFARRHALEQVRAEQPLWLPRKLVRNLGLLWQPDSPWLERLRDGGYPGPSRAAARTLLLLHLGLYALVLCGAALGVARAQPPDRRLLALLLVGLALALHVATNATPRFRVPWLPLLTVYAAYAATSWRRGGRPTARALAAPLAVAIFLVWSSAAFFADDAATLWSATFGP